jgi:hypothetical protein
MRRCLQIIGLGFLLILFVLSCSSQSRDWRTDIAPSDKPSVNFVVSQEADGSIQLQSVLLTYENPEDGKVEKRKMKFNVKELIGGVLRFELPEVPGEVYKITFPATLGHSFEAKLTTQNGEETILDFIEY